MKFKATQKAVKNFYRNVIRVGYCGLQYLLYYQNPIAYTCGVYGWNADVYEIGGGLAICTGYRPLGNITVDYDIVRKYDDMAREIVYNRDTYEKQKEQLNILLNNFINEIMKEVEE